MGERFLTMGLHELADRLIDGRAGALGKGERIALRHLVARFQEGIARDDAGSRDGGVAAFSCTN